MNKNNLHLALKRLYNKGALAGYMERVVGGDDNRIITKELAQWKADKSHKEGQAMIEQIIKEVHGEPSVINLNYGESIDDAPCRGCGKRPKFGMWQCNCDSSFKI